VMNEDEAIEMVQLDFESKGLRRGKVKFARLEPANSTDPGDDKHPDPHWLIFFDAEIPDFDPDFFVVSVNCHTGEIKTEPVM